MFLFGDERKVINNPEMQYICCTRKTTYERQSFILQQDVSHVDGINIDNVRIFRALPGENRQSV